MSNQRNLTIWKHIVDEKRLATQGYRCLVASDTTSNKNLFLETTFSTEGKPSTTLTLYHMGRKVDSYWGLPMAVEAYNKI